MNTPPEVLEAGTPPVAQGPGAERRERPSSRDVARVAGVSRATVSYVLNDRRDLTIPETTRARVHAVARELGYRTNTLAQALKTGRIGVVGLWFSALNSPFVNSLQRAFYERAQAAGYDVLITDLQWERLGSPEALERLTRWPLDGAIVYAPENLVKTIRARYLGHAPAMVSICWEPSSALDHVWWNMAPGAKEAMDHLISSGRTKIAYVASPMGLQQEEARHCAFIQAMDKAGLQPRIIAVPADDRGTARLAVKSAIRAGEPLDALFCYNDDFALAARAAVEECGLSVPHDVAIVGYDGLPEGEYMTPPLSTVLVPAGDIARLAWELLQRRMEEPAAAVRCEVIEPRLIVRASSKTP